jgi:hypothetical protein
MASTNIIDSTNYVYNGVILRQLTFVRPSAICYWEVVK